MRSALIVQKSNDGSGKKGAALEQSGEHIPRSSCKPKYTVEAAVCETLRLGAYPHPRPTLGFTIQGCKDNSRWMVKHPVVGEKSRLQCAGVNRHEVEDERALRERSSDPLGPESCAVTARDTAKRRQGIGGVGIQLRKDAIRTPTFL